MGRFRSPITEKEILNAREILKKTGLVEDITICNCIWRIHKAIRELMDHQELKSKIISECEVGLIYAKRMDVKLKEYHGKGEYEL